MADETKRIEAIAGPYKGQRLDVPAADANRAIKDGWARDPFEPVDPDAAPPEFDQDKHDKMMVAAEKAARKLRGEEEPKAAKADPQPETKTGRTRTAEK